MICKKCGFILTNQANFCPSCGKKTQDSSFDSSLPKSSVKWLKVLLAFILIGIVLIISLILFSQDMTDTVTEQLKKIKMKKISEAYYDHTSTSFQEATPLNRFREFLEEHSAFAHNPSIRFIDRKQEDTTGRLEALILTNEGIEVPIQYHLIKEGDKWRISSIKLNEASSILLSKKSTLNKKEIQNEEFNSQQIRTPIESQLDTIRLNHLKEAYHEYTSKEFKTTTSFKDFEDFIKNNPGLSKNILIRFNSLSFDNNIAIISATLTASDHSTYPVTYELVEENNNWKILHIRIPSSQEITSTLSSLEFTNFILGNAVNHKGSVLFPTTTFDSKTDDIYANLSIYKATSGTKITLIFEHLDTHSTIEPVSTKIAENGNSILTFIFSPPTKGWPKGNYRVLANASTGENAKFDFLIKD